MNKLKVINKKDMNYRRMFETKDSFLEVRSIVKRKYYFFKIPIWSKTISVEAIPAWEFLREATTGC